jgi:hypothetical protein
MAYVHEYRDDEFHPAEIEMLRVKRIPITRNTGKPRWKTKRKGHLGSKHEERIMGIRMDQFAGLPQAAEKFLEEHEKPPVYCETCGHVIKRSVTRIGSYSGMFSDTYPLHRRHLKDGRTADEYLQAAPWSSGPVHFIGLKVSDGTVFEWSEEEMEGWL